MHNIGKVQSGSLPQPNAQVDVSPELPILTDNTIFDQYQIIEMVGTGKFSHVFKAIEVETSQLAAIKVLKQIRIEKIQKEINMLEALPQSEFIIRLKVSKQYCLIFPYIDHKDIRDLKRSQLKLPRIRTYIYKVLQALHIAHQANIMHRDIKPLNILYNPATEQVVLTDWGVAENYCPETEYRLKVGSLYFKAPQLLLNCSRYDYSIDIWSLGCVLAGLIFSKHIFFKGNDDLDQLHRILKCIGTKQILSFVQQNKLVPSQQVTEMLVENQYNKKEWAAYLTKKNRRNNNQNAFNLLSKMLVIDPHHRISARDALTHPFFHQN